MTTECNYFSKGQMSYHLDVYPQVGKAESRMGVTQGQVGGDKGRCWSKSTKFQLGSMTSSARDQK
jgi:hypothetical protein